MSGEKTQNLGILAFQKGLTNRLVILHDVINQRRFFAGNTFHTKQGNRLSCRDQEGRWGSDEVGPGL